MINLNQKTKDRLIKGIKKYKPIVKKAKDNDINESDTVTIITDILCNVLGFDKYEEITSEYAIKKTYCDLAIKLDNKINEIKMIRIFKPIGMIFVFPTLENK